MFTEDQKATIHYLNLYNQLPGIIIVDLEDIYNTLAMPNGGMVFTFDRLVQEFLGDILEYIASENDAINNIDEFLNDVYNQYDDEGALCVEWFAKEIFTLYKTYGLYTTHGLCVHEYREMVNTTALVLQKLAFDDWRALVDF